MATAMKLIWIGPLVTAAGAISYFLIFARFPALRDIPWVNLPLVGLGVLLSLLGLLRAIGPGRRRWLASAGLAFSLLLGCVFGLYVFWLSYQLPGAAGVTVEASLAADFTLLDQNGRPVTLSELRGRKIVLVFYRGHW